MRRIIQSLNPFKFPWLLLALLSWGIIILTCHKQKFLHALPAGLWTLAVGSLLEHFFITHRFWEERFILIHLGGFDAFLAIGPFFSIGLLLAAFLPESRWRIMISVLLWCALATGVELVAVRLGFLQYGPGRWGAAFSFLAYLLGLTSALGFYFAYYRHQWR